MTCLLNTLRGEKYDKPPVWLMRQAGRYLPEYQSIRQKYDQFLAFCQNSEASTEVTLQPIRRYDLDAGIVFSDILTIPAAMGIDVSFVKGEGPRLLWSKNRKDLSFDPSSHHLQATYMTLENVKALLPQGKTLIGFCGAPWTLACYMYDDKPSKDTPNLRCLAHESPDIFDQLMAELVNAVVVHASGQIRAGAEVIQLFDSWANAVPHNLLEQAVIKPLIAICQKLKKQYPEVPLILFPKAVPLVALQSLCTQGEGLFEGIGFHHTQSMSDADVVLPKWVAFQGNLDPAILLTRPEVIQRETKALKQQLSPSRRWVANLGHGVLPPTPPEHVRVFVETIREK